MHDMYLYTRYKYVYSIYVYMNLPKRRFLQKIFPRYGNGVGVDGNHQKFDCLSFCDESSVAEWIKPLDAPSWRSEV